MVELFEKQVLKSTEEYVKSIHEGEGSGHDWWHIDRVRKMALKLAEKEGGSLFIIEMAALLHDIDDWKISDENSSKVSNWLKKLKINHLQSSHINEVINQVSFKGAGVENKATSIEAKVVQDSDRLDAIGAIGVARAFAYGGNKKRALHIPGSTPGFHTDFESYKNNQSSTVNHFYEKLLLLKNSLNTQTAIEIAKNRHIFMETFLQQFFAEWEGRK
jgi:uncharacterized protein